MPAFRDIDPGFNGDALKALYESSRGRNLAVVSQSYPLPSRSEAEVVDYHGENTARALEGLLKLIRPIDGLVIAIAPDSYGVPCLELARSVRVIQKLGLNALVIRRNGDLDDADPLARRGFYDLANSATADSLFIRTPEEAEYASAMYLAGSNSD